MKGSANHEPPIISRELALYHAHGERWQEPNQGYVILRLDIGHGTPPTKSVLLNAHHLDEVRARKNGGWVALQAVPHVAFEVKDDFTPMGGRGAPAVRMYVVVWERVASRRRRSSKHAT